MTTKHTPGPWISEGGDGYGGRWIGTEDGTHIAGAYIPIHDSSSLTKEQAEANARLIAAAPELLEAARKSVSRLKNLPETHICNVVIGILEEAIQKATQNA